jgi:isoquinoline 1-oxidoreductase alpha subunit
MANSIRIKVNGLTHGVTASLDTPLLYVLHNEPPAWPRFGCGLAQCNACSVLLDGKEDRSCVTRWPRWQEGITTLEGLPALFAARGQRGCSGAASLQQAWIDVQCRIAATARTG